MTTDRTSVFRPGPPARLRALGHPAWGPARCRAALAELATVKRPSILKAPADGRSVVLAFEFEQVALVAKCLALDTPARWLRAACRGSSLDNQARAAARLTRAQIPVAPHLAVAIAPPALVLLTVRVPGQTLLGRLRDGEADLTHADAVGRGIALLARRGLDDRDHKPSNLVLSTEHDVPVLVDPAGVRRRTPRVPRMLAALYLEPTGLGVPPRATLCLRAAKTAASDPRHALRAAADLVRAHGDPRPKDALSPE